MFARSPYEIPAAHPRVKAMGQAASPESSRPLEPIGMSFWTDASVLGDAGIPSLLFGPTGAGLHGVEEWVETASVIACRDALVALTRRWCAGS
jgi:acetylornithine deacetylase